MTSTAGPPKLVNLYNLRQTATAKPCFICSKETSHCLANAELSDWIYVCHGHVLDPAVRRRLPSRAWILSPTSQTKYRLSTVCETCSVIDDDDVGN